MEVDVPSMSSIIRMQDKQNTKSRQKGSQIESNRQREEYEPVMASEGTSWRCRAAAAVLVVALAVLMVGPGGGAPLERGCGEEQ